MALHGIYFLPNFLRVFDSPERFVARWRMLHFASAAAHTHKHRAKRGAAASREPQEEARAVGGAVCV